MATGARMRHGGGTIADPSGITERSRVVAREVPEFQSSRAGLETLGASFSNFFNQGISALETMQNADHAVEMAKVRRENEEQKAKGAADVAKGQAPDETLTNDYDYIDSYKIAHARKQSSDLALEFQTFAQTFPVDGSQGSLSDAREQFIRERTKNGNSYGVGDPLYDAELYGTFNAQTDKLVATHTANTTKHVVERGMLNVEQNIFNNPPSDLASAKQWVDLAATAYPQDPSMGKARAISAMIESVQNREQAAHMSRMLNEKDAAGNSLLDGFPAETRTALETRMVNRFTTSLTTEGAVTLAGLKDRLLTAGSPADYTSVITEAYAAMSKHGGESSFRPVISSALTSLQKHINETADARIGLDAINGKGVAEQKHYEAAVLSMAAANNLDPLAEPEVAAGLVVKGKGHVPKAWKDTFEANLTDMTNPATMASAMRFYGALDGAMSDRKVTSLMDGPAAQMYTMLERRMRLTSKPLEEIALDMQKARDQLGNLDSLREGFAKRVYPSASNATEAKQKIINSIQKELRSDKYGLGDDVIVDAGLSEDLFSMLQTNMIMSNAGAGDLAPSVEALASSVAGRLTTYSSFGKYIVTSRDPAPGSVQLGPQVVNPMTGDIENTGKTQMEDLKLLADGMGYDEDDLTVAPHYDFADPNHPGVMLVEDRKGPIIFQKGQKATLGGIEVTIPDNDEDAATFSQFVNDGYTGSGSPDEMLADSARDDPGTSANANGYVLIPTPDGEGYMLGLKSRFKHNPSTIEELETERQSQIERKRAETAQEVAKDTLRSLRQDSAVAPSTDVTKPVDWTKVKDAHSIERIMRDWKRDNERYRKGASLDRSTTDSAQTYMARLEGFIGPLEGKRRTVYEDHNGNKTIGIGFNMDAPGAEQRWVAAGLRPEMFEAVYNKVAALDPKEITALFRTSIQEAEKYVDSLFDGADLNDHQRQALTSLAFNSPALIPAGGVIHTAIKTGNYGAVLYDILYGNNPDSMLGVARRRFHEAAMWAGGLGLEKVLPDYESYISSVTSGQAKQVTASGAMIAGAADHTVDELPEYVKPVKEVFQSIKEAALGFTSDVGSVLADIGHVVANNTIGEPAKAAALFLGINLAKEKGLELPQYEMDEGFFSSSSIGVMESLIGHAKSKGRSYVTYDDYDALFGKLTVGDSDLTVAELVGAKVTEERAAEFQGGRAKTLSKLVFASLRHPALRVGLTLGRFGFKDNGDSFVVVDDYNFNAGAEERPDDYSKLRNSMASEVTPYRFNIKVPKRTK